MIARKPKGPLRERAVCTLHLTADRLYNRWFDLRARLAGYCNNAPWRPEPDRGGGYAHWRCALRRHHEGLHRYRNYVWCDDGSVDYVPIPITRVNQPSVDQPWDRKLTKTRRQARAAARWMAMRTEAMRAEREQRRGPDDDWIDL